MSEGRQYADKKAEISKSNKLIDPNRNYSNQIASFNLLSRQEERKQTKLIWHSQKRIIYQLCILDSYHGSLEFCLNSDLKEIVLFGKDNFSLDIKLQLSESLKTIDKINKEIKRLNQIYKTTKRAYKQRDLEKRICFKRIHKFNLLSTFNISKGFLNQHINNLIKLTEVKGIFSEQDTNKIKLAYQINKQYKELFDNFICSNLKLVARIAGKYSSNRNSSYIARDDLIQIGNNGLIDALERFDYRKGYKFSTYASWWIKQGILKNRSTQYRAMRMPIHVLDAANKIKKLKDRLKIENKSLPYTEKIAEICNLSVFTVKNALAVLRPVVSLDLKVNKNSNDSFKIFIEDKKTEKSDSRLETEELRQIVRSALDSIPEREKQILCLRYGLSDGKAHTLKECGRVLNLSKERVRQIEKKVKRKLKHVSKGLIKLLNNN